MNSDRKKPLYRKVNTTARGVHHNIGGDFRNHRRTEEYDSIGMKSGVQRGLDYTPLFKFLLSKVGQTWDKVHSEAISRLDKPDPIFWMVSLDRDQAEDVVVIGSNSYFSGLYIDSSGMLQIVNPTIGPESLEPTCACCTHTFNGHPFTKKYNK
jgi:hypothetical protein